MNLLQATQLTNLNDTDRKVIAAAGAAEDLFDAWNYPSNEAVKRITETLGRDPEDQFERQIVYYALKSLRVRLNHLQTLQPEAA